MALNNQALKSGAVKLKQRVVQQNTGSTSRAEFLPTNDFEELNKLINGEVTQA